MTIQLHKKQQEVNTKEIIKSTGSCCSRVLSKKRFVAMAVQWPATVGMDSRRHSRIRAVVGNRVAGAHART